MQDILINGSSAGLLFMGLVFLAEGVRVKDRSIFYTGLSCLLVGVGGFVLTINGCPLVHW